MELFLDHLNLNNGDAIKINTRFIVGNDSIAYINWQNDLGAKTTMTEVKAKTINESSKKKNELIRQLLWGIVFTGHAEVLIEMLGPLTTTCNP